MKCNICGHNKFEKGPKGRLSGIQHKLPQCVKCKSLERHRAARVAWDKIIDDSYKEKDCLHFSYDPTINHSWFNFIEVSIFDNWNPINMKDIPRPDNHYDVVIANGVLEHVSDDYKAVNEVLRVLKPDGFAQIYVPFLPSMKETDDWGYPKKEFFNHYRTYGSDILTRFKETSPELEIFRFKTIDPVTQETPSVFFLSSSKSTIMNLEKKLST